MKNVLVEVERNIKSVAESNQNRLGLGKGVPPTRSATDGRGRCH